MEDQGRFGKLLQFIQAPGRWADEQSASARQGLEQMNMNAAKLSDPNMSDEDALKQAKDTLALAEQGGAMTGTISNIGGAKGVKTITDFAKTMPAKLEEYAIPSATQQIIGAEHGNLSQLAKEMALKNKPRWGN